MSALERVLQALEARGLTCKGNEHAGYVCQCPAHEDGRPSLKVDLKDDRVLLKCYAGCEPREILGALNLTWQDLFDGEKKEREGHGQKASVLERYDYKDEEGKLLYQVERMVPKSFRQRAPDPAQAGHWIWKLEGVRRVIYRLPEVLDAITMGERIIVVEGERDVHTLEGKGFTATTNAGGAGKWRGEFAQFFPAGTEVAIIVDRDEPDPKTHRRPGYEHGLTVYKNLYERGCVVKIFECPEHKDISEHLAAGKLLRDLRPLTPEFLENYLQHTEPTQDSPSDSQMELASDLPQIRVMTAKEIAALPEPDRSGYLLGPLVNRGHRLMIAARSGHGKTSMTLRMLSAIMSGEQFLQWNGIGLSNMGQTAMVLDVEQGIGTVRRRVIEAGLGGREDVIYAVAPDGLALDSSEATVDYLETLFDKYKPAVVLADPFYKLHQGDPNDTQKAVALMRRFDDWRTRYNFALLLPMHVRKAPSAGAKFSMDEIFGASAYQWGAEIVVGLERKKKGYSHLHWWKDREGDLDEIDSRWGLTFDPEHGFRRDPHDLDKAPILQRVKMALLQEPGLTLDEIREKTGAGHKTVRQSLDNLGATARTGSTLKDKEWVLPPALFEYDGAEEALEDQYVGAP